MFKFRILGLGLRMGFRVQWLLLTIAGFPGAPGRRNLEFQGLGFRALFQEALNLISFS